MREVRMPKLNTNDSEFVLVEWACPDDAFLHGGDPLAVVETSKATQDVAVESDGVVRRVGVLGDAYPAGAVVALQFDTRREAEAYAGPTEPADRSAPPDDGPPVTEPARALADAHGIAMDRLRRLDVKVVRRADVESLLAAEGGTNASPAEWRSREQLAVARVVEESHREIPAAFTVVRARMDDALARIRVLARTGGVVLGLAELLVLAIGRLDRDMPEFFGRPPDAVPEPGWRADVGITIDAGTGLFVPVVPRAAEKSPRELAGLLMDHRRKAVTRRFHETDLRPADIALSLHDEPDVVLAQAIVFPGHVCVVSAGAVLPEPGLDPDGDVVSRSCLHLGLTYDHRYLNGRDAVRFLRGIKDLVEDPERLLGGAAETLA